MRIRRCGVLTVSLLLLAGCGGSFEPEELVAVPYPEPEPEAVELSADAEAEDVPNAQAPAAGRDTAGEEALGELVTDDGPPLALVREFLAAREQGVTDRDHLLADLTEDGLTEVVVAMVDRGHRAVVEVARWTDDERFETTERLAAGLADQLGRLRLADLSERASRVLVLALHHEGATRLAVWAPDAHGSLEPPERCPVDAVAVLRSSFGTKLTLACDPSGVADDALVWDDGAFRPFLVDEPAAEELPVDRPGAGGG